MTMDNKFINTPKYNVLLIVLSILISWLISYTGEISGAGVGVVAIVLLPLFAGILTIVLYTLSFFVTKNYNWIISLVGIIYNIYMGVQFHFNLI